MDGPWKKTRQNNKGTQEAKTKVETMDAGKRVFEKNSSGDAKSAQKRRGVNWNSDVEVNHVKRTSSEDVSLQEQWSCD
jgi:hypothetical protein